MTTLSESITDQHPRMQIIRKSLQRIHLCIKLRKRKRIKKNLYPKYHFQKVYKT